MSDKSQVTPARDASRRDFLKTAAAGAAGAGLSLSAPVTETANAQTTPPSSKSYDVVVVGAGVAGIYAAYRLAYATVADLKTNAATPLAKILATNGKLTVAIFDYSGRIGGRLLSVQVPGAPSYYAEFGGFRLQHQMQIVWNTAQVLLKLTDEDFGYEKNANPLSLRGFEFTFAQLNQGQANPFGTPSGGGNPAWPTLPYNLTDFEYSLFAKGGLGALGSYVTESSIIYTGPGGPISYSTMQTNYTAGMYNGLGYAYTDSTGRTFPATKGDFTLAITASQQYESAKQTSVVAGRQLFDWGYWALKRHWLSQEAVALLEDSSGYNEEAQTGNTPWNLDEGFYFLGEPESDLSKDINTAAPSSWRHIKTGYDAIPGGLAQLFESKTNPSGKPENSQIFLNHQLISFDKVAAGGYQLTFTKRTPGRGDVQTAAQAEDNTDNVTVGAQAIILALPRKALQLIDQNNFFFKENQVQQLLYDSVVPVYALRMFMAYKDAWWAEKFPNIANGRSTTDLGVRQFYYWNVEPGADGTPYKGPALLLSSYSSGSAEEYWKQIQKGQPYDDLPGGLGNTAFQNPSKQIAANRAGPRPASVTMATEAHRQLREALGMSDYYTAGGQGPFANQTNSPAPLVDPPYYAHFQNWTKEPWGAGWHSWNEGQNYTDLIPKIRQPLPLENIFVIGECFSDKPGWVSGALNSAEALVQCNVGLKWPTSFLDPASIWLGPGTKWLTKADIQAGSLDPCLPPPETIPGTNEYVC